MNYIKQINAFWEMERDRGDFTAHLQSFYFALLYFANKYGKDEFTLYREDVMTQAKVSKNHYYTVRDLAAKAGLIQFKEGASKRSKVVFKVIQLSQDVSHSVSQNKDKECDKDSDTLCDHTHKLTKVDKLTKPIKQSSLHQLAVAAFHEDYKTRFATEYIFKGGKDGKAIKELLSNIQKKIKESEMEPTDENTLQGFTLFLQSITDKWVLNNYNPAVLNSKFNELFKQAKNGKQQQTSESGIAAYIQYCEERGHY